MSMISLMNKFRNVPDLFTIHDKLRVVQVEAKTASEETAQALAKIKEKIHGNIAEEHCGWRGDEGI